MATRGSGAASATAITRTRDSAPGRLVNDGVELAAVSVEHAQGVARLQPQHAREVLGFFVGKRNQDRRAHAHRVHGTSRSRRDYGSTAVILLPPHMFLKGQTVGKLRILSPLGSGGFGTVYLAEDTWIDKKVAIKVPHKQNLDFGELLREPRLLASRQPSEHRHRR